MTKPSIIKGLIGLVLLGAGVSMLPYIMLAVFGFAIVGLVIPGDLITVLIGFSVFGLIIDLAMIFFGLKLVNSNRAPFINLLLAITGLLTIIIAILIAVGGFGAAPETGGISLAAEMIAVGLFILGVSFIDLGAHTKFVKPVSNAIARIK